MRRGLEGLAVLALLAAVGADTAFAQVRPERGAGDARLRVVAYDPNQVVRLEGRVGYHLDLEFAPDETFVGLAGGDLEALTFAARGSVLTLKPKAAPIATNLAVTTSRRRYYFDYVVPGSSYGALPAEAMYAVRFTYAAVSGGADPNVRIERALAEAAAARTKNYDYGWCGARALKPIAAWDDGVQTRLAFGPRQELPAAFVQNADGTESLVNFHVDGEALVLHRVAERLVLRRGRLAGCVVNRGRSGGERLESGTLAPEVRRERREPAP